MRRFGPPGCCSIIWSRLTGSEPPSRALARRSHAWSSAGNGPGMSWRDGRGLAPSKRGLKRGLTDRSRTVILMLDETIVTETPPLYNCYGPIGEQVRVPISGEHAKRVLHGAINIRSGDLALLITEDWTQDTHEAFLRMVRAHWRGWNLVVFEDRASQHKAARAWA